MTASQAIARYLRAGCNLALQLLIRLLLAPVLRWRAARFPRRSVLFAGQAYYNAWYLSRALRETGWKADVLNWVSDPATQIYYHGEDFKFEGAGFTAVAGQLLFYLRALWTYDIFHFSNAHGISFGSQLQAWFSSRFTAAAAEIRLLKAAGKKIVYTNNGCLDGVSQTAFSKWGPESICAICPWRNTPTVCSDELNLSWGRFRNSVADYQCLLGGNRVDYNDDARVHEVPEFYCLDENFWRPGLEIPAEYRLDIPAGTVHLFHAVGNLASRTDKDGVNIKSSHIYLPLVQQLSAEGLPVSLLSFSTVPNRILRYYQAQADIFLDMLTYGFFGATAREGMMLGKPVVCFLRPEWLESMRREIPEYVDELPIVNATPATVREVLVDLIRDRAKREEIGRKSRAFAVKWHSSRSAGPRFDRIYSELLGSGAHHG